jgi:hypothetical protein
MAELTREVRMSLGWVFESEEKIGRKYNKDARDAHVRRLMWSFVYQNISIINNHSQ